MGLNITWPDGTVLNMAEAPNLYAYVCQHEVEEHIVAVQVGGDLMPLCDVSRERIEGGREAAADLARRHNVEIKLVRFSRAEVLEVLKP